MREKDGVKTGVGEITCLVRKVAPGACREIKLMKGKKEEEFTVSGKKTNGSAAGNPPPRTGELEV